MYLFIKLYICVFKSLSYLSVELLDEVFLIYEGQEGVDLGLDAGFDLATPAVGTLYGETFLVG